jgi:SARP family transcriptional regulator, regulator of embCAB operon
MGAQADDHSTAESVDASGSRPDGPAVLGFNVLGSTQMTIDGVGVPLGTPKQKALLAMLIINRNRPVGTDALITAAWEDWPPPKANASVYTYVAELRKLVSDAGLDPKKVLTTAPPGYQLNVADNQCDIGRFQANHSAGIQAAAEGHFEQARQHLGVALAEWKGHALADLRDLRFAQVFATALERDRIMAVTVWAEAEIACGRADTVLADLEVLTADHPYEEPLWAQLITALYLTGRQADALAACRRVRKILDDDHGIEPGPRIGELQERILRQEQLGVQHAAKNSAMEMITMTSHPSFAESTASVSVSLSDTTTGQHYALTSAVARIGRLDDNDIVLTDPKVSRHHAVIVDTGATYLIVDHHSANGVRVDGERIKTSAMLTDGARIGIGGNEFVLEVR